MRASRLSPESRQRGALLVLAVSLVILAAGMFHLQIIEYSRLWALSENNRIRIQPIVPQRGILYDRHGAALVENRLSYTVSVVRSEMDKQLTVRQLSSLIDLDSTTIMNKLRGSRTPGYLPAAVVRDVGFEKIAILEEQNSAFPGVTYETQMTRRYLPGLAAECFTGYLGEVSDDDTARNPELRLGSFIGKHGIERQYDELLRGSEGIRFLEVTARGEVVGDLADRRPQPAKSGVDLELSIDATLQQAAAREIDSFCCGAIVALDPRTGEALCMVSRPRYDANVFSGTVPSDIWRSIVSDPNRPLLNRPVNARYQPGSTFKLVTAGALLEEKIVNRHTLLSPCRGGWQFGTRFFKCWNEGGHGSLDLVGSVERSCNAYFYQAGAKLGQEKLAMYARACGFGVKTGVDLPQENAGLNPTPAVMNKLYPHGWTRAGALNFAIGQGELVATPLQLAQFYAGLANNGVVYRPHFLKTVTTIDGRRRTMAPEVSFTLPFSIPTLALLKEALWGVVNSAHGTGGRMRDPELVMAGKTGTAQNPHGNEHSWFVGFAPYENPEIVIAVIVENAGHGSDVAAPVAGRLMKLYLQGSGAMLAHTGATNGASSAAENARGAR